MNQYFADLHIHLGGSSEGTPVKITASRKLTFDAVINECVNRKGIDIAGIVDCACPKIIRDIEALIKKGIIYELPEGGLLHKDRLLIIPSSETEASEGNGRLSHHIGYFPYMKNIKEFSYIMKDHIKNQELSSQQCGLKCEELYQIIIQCGGIPVPAHAFTPHKSIYGKVTDSIKKIFSPETLLSVPAVELGLSADTEIADYLSELSQMSFLTSSDAHSLGKIAREYTVFEMERLNFTEFSLALRRNSMRRIISNFGMNPKLGKYHRSYCKKCDKVIQTAPPVLKCPYCQRDDKDFIIGVLDRLTQIKDREKSQSPNFRPPYFYQIPLEFVPGVSKRILDKLINAFGSEMAILNIATEEEIKEVVGETLAEKIMSARNGTLALESGGGGKYGFVKRDDRQEQFPF